MEHYSAQLFRGLTTRDIQSHFKDVYGVDVSAGFISQVTNAVMDEVKRWQQRPLDALYPIDSSATAESAECALDAFAAKWDQQFPTISQSWKNNWERLIVIFDFPPEIRKVIYTTNAIGSLNASLRKITKTRRIFPTDDSVLKLLYLALHNISAKWTMPLRDWKPAMSQFMLMYGERISS
ncbi:hypothetical protein SODG_006023 [Sodalis praecaptivus]